MKICILPLDSRPCSYDFVKALAEINGVTAILPPLDDMGFFRESSKHATISRWLIENATNCDAAVISIDQLLYGGLIASRQNLITAEEALARLELLSKLKEKNPSLKIYACTVLMRTTVSTLNLEGKIWWEAVAQYSKYSYLVARDPSNKENVHTLQELKDKIPKTLLDEFLAARKRNHTVNKACVELTQKGVIDYLPILQEDCTEAGLHKIEQEHILDIIRQHNLEYKVPLHNGTDEATAELLARAVTTEPMPVNVRWLGSEQNDKFVALFEDRPFKQNLDSHLATVNIAKDDSANTVLFIYPPKGNQADFCTDDEAPPITGYSPAELKSFADEISDAVKCGAKVYLLDVAFANGGDYELLSHVAAQVDILDLYGYSAWNTACNALGTILSQIVLSNGQNSELNKQFTAKRILDDVIYQGIVRKSLNNELLRIGDDPWCIQNLSQAKELLEINWELAKPQITTLLGENAHRFKAQLRWPRTFEVEIV